MKAAVCSMGDSLDALVDPRFGRCANFVIVDTDTMEFTVEKNPGVMMAQGAGIQAAQLLAQQGVQAVIAGNYGPNAYQVLATAGIRMYQGVGGTVRQAVEQMQAGSLGEVGSATVAAHQGMAPGGVPGRGMGMGMGRGGRRGRGGW